MIVLGIESSCDETGVAVFDSERGLLSHVLHSQVELHAEYGGVVPELASRDHIRYLLPLTEQALQQAGVDKNALDGIAYTAGPGLIGALMSGAAMARSLAWALQVPAVEVHHMEGHLLAPLLEQRSPSFPFIALLVSGGHTLLAKVEGIGEYHIIGQSLDDAAGEAFDKTAKLLGLGYPGGPVLARAAEDGQPGRFTFPRPMTDRPGLDFSFSGLKTYALNTMQEVARANGLAADGAQDANLGEQDKADIALAFEQAVVDTLVFKCRRALTEDTDRPSEQPPRLIVAGGVGANRRLRSSLQEMVDQLDGELYFPRIEFCTDNGAMIALAGSLRLMAGQTQTLAIEARARWSLQDLAAL